MAMQDRYPFRFIGTSAGQHDAAELDQEIAASCAGAIERDSGLTVPTRLDDEGARDALTELAVLLDRAQVPYALTGSAAGYFYGLNRSTADFDVLVDLGRGGIDRVLEAFTTGFYLDEEMIRGAVSRGGSFNIISHEQGWKADFFVMKDDPLDQEALEHALVHGWHGTTVRVLAAADLVLNKLRWAKESGSQRQLSDIRTIMSAPGWESDERFEAWVRRLGVEDTLDAAASARYDA